MILTIPEFCLVVLIGPSGCGKSTFARKYFKSTQVISSDRCRALISDDESDQSVTKDAFEIVHFIAGKRLAAGRLAVIDATSVQPEARKPLIGLAMKNNAIPLAIVFNLPVEFCVERDRQRPDRQVGSQVILTQHQNMLSHLNNLEDEGFQLIYTLSSPQDVDVVTITTSSVPPQSR